MIKGIGIDLVDLNRIKTLIDERFISRILSKEEQEIYHNIHAENTKLGFIGGRFAAKEALFKAISKGDMTTNYIDFSILNHNHGLPFVKTDYFKDGEIIHISISHTNDYAIAYVVIEKL
jgi:holo-[acyl-carrier protein] synthase